MHLDLFNEGTNFILNPLEFSHSIAESICTHYSNLSCQPNIFLGSGTFKKLETLLFAKSRVQKSKKEETRLPLLFLNNNDLVFLHPAIFKKQGTQFFFQSHKPTLVFKTRIVVQVDWAIELQKHSHFFAKLQFLVFSNNLRSENDSEFA